MRRLRDEPTVVSKVREIALPNLALLRRETVEPRQTSFITLAQPATRRFWRRLKELPKIAKPRTEVLLTEPKDARPLAEHAAPMRTKARTETELAMNPEARMEVWEAMRTEPLTESEEPAATMPKTLMRSPVSSLPITERAEEARTNARIENELPREK